MIKTTINLLSKAGFCTQNFVNHPPMCHYGLIRTHTALYLRRVGVKDSLEKHSPTKSAWQIPVSYTHLRCNRQKGPPDLTPAIRAKPDAVFPVRCISIPLPPFVRQSIRIFLPFPLQSNGRSNADRSSPHRFSQMTAGLFPSAHSTHPNNRHFLPILLPYTGYCYPNSR